MNVTLSNLKASSVRLGTLVSPALMLCAAITIFVALASPVTAQEPEMPAEAPAEDVPAEEPPAADPAEMPNDAPAEDAEGEVTEAADETDVADITNPAVQAVLESEPRTPVQLLRAIKILVDLGHPKSAKPLVTQLTEMKLDIEAQAALAKAFNSAVLIKLARDKTLGESLAPFLDEMLRGAETYRRDPRRLTAFAKQLSDPNDATRAAATLALLEAHSAAVAPLAAILADPKRAAEHAAAASILVELGGDAVPPLLGVLESPNEALNVKIMGVLGRLRAKQAVSQLLAPLLSTSGSSRVRSAAAAALKNISGYSPTTAEALRLLEHAARNPLEQSRLADDVALAPVEVWHWNAKKKESMPIGYTPTGARLAVAARLARQLYALDTQNIAYRRLYLIALLQAAKFRVGLDKPLLTGAGTAHDAAVAQGIDAVDEALAAAIAGGYIPAATAAAQILGNKGAADLLNRSGAELSPLARAAAHADHRLRFQAINSIMKLSPSEPFAGSNHVVDGLGYFASSYGTPRILVVHPRSDQAQTIAGLAAELGYESDIATNGRRAFEQAVRSPDYEFVLIHSMVQKPAADELVAQLRRDGRTALLPIGVIALVNDWDRVEQFTRTDPRMMPLLQPMKPDEMKLFAADLTARAGRARVPDEVRQAQAIAALDWLFALAEKPNRVFDVYDQEAPALKALWVPALSTKAAALLGELGTAAAQRALVELADMPSQPLAVREAATVAFARAVRKHGIMLTSAEILGQYNYYNANGGRDAATQAILSSLLDTMENQRGAALVR